MSNKKCMADRPNVVLILIQCLTPQHQVDIGYAVWKVEATSDI